MSATGVGHAHAVGAGVVACRPVRTESELEQHRTIRHRVFSLEQAIFVGTDLDDRDEDPETICLLGFCGRVAAGTVRLYELDHSTGLWQGDRLAVLPEHRAAGLGAPLVRCAVAMAGALGGREMVAHVQLPNVAFFSRLGWSPDGDTEVYAGRPHQRMRIGLPGRERGAGLVAALARGV